MSNPWRGEVDIVIDGTPHIMRLTLGALAELEDKLQTESLVDLVERFESGAFRSADVIALLGAGLSGGGAGLGRDDLLSAEIDGGPMAAAKAAARLLALAFAEPGNVDV
ncbi:MAG: gene transfer agent family protein [Pseudoprimorskyibacter sp.]|jgi:hypothetical protein|nr:gene transfer agent family protein [Pseudoprimorskyibacter sp.]